MKVKLTESSMGLWFVTINDMPIVIGGDNDSKEKALFNALIENQKFVDAEIVVEEFQPAKPPIEWRKRSPIDWTK